MNVAHAFGCQLSAMKLGGIFFPSMDRLHPISAATWVKTLSWRGFWAQLAGAWQTAYIQSQRHSLYESGDQRERGAKSGKGLKISSRFRPSQSTSLLTEYFFWQIHKICSASLAQIGPFFSLICITNNGGQLPSFPFSLSIQLFLKKCFKSHNSWEVCWGFPFDLVCLFMCAPESSSQESSYIYQTSKARLFMGGKRRWRQRLKLNQPPQANKSKSWGSCRQQGQYEGRQEDEM